MSLARFSETPIPFYLSQTIPGLLMWNDAASKLVAEDAKAARAG